MAFSFSSLASASNRITVAIPILVLLISVASAVLLFLLSSVFLCCCQASLLYGFHGGCNGDTLSKPATEQRIWTTTNDIQWVKEQIRANGLHLQENVLRKGINPRTRKQQLQDLIQFKGISHHEGPGSENHTALECPPELLVEDHHSYYGEPWAGGRDIFEFLAKITNLNIDSHVLEIGCGTLRVGLHFIQYLNPEHYHCIEKDELSLMAAFSYELPSHGLLHKRPLIVRDENMDLTKLGAFHAYDLIYASAVFLHMPDKLVWVGLERLAAMLKPSVGRIFVSHNIKFCSRLGGDECTRRLTALGLAYIGKHTHDSLLFNHFEIWFEFGHVLAT